MFPSNRFHVLSLSILLATALLAGCASPDAPGVVDDGNTPDVPTMEAALAAEGLLLSPTDRDHDLRLKLLSPADPAAVEEGALEVVFLLFDEEEGSPVTGADLGPDQPGCGPDHGFCAEMPAMGHGTSPEQAPVHVAQGIYRGSTTLSMPGQWVLHLRPMVDGEVVAFSTTLEVGGAQDHREQAPVPTFDSFEAAHAADGPVFEPTENASTLRLKLLHPNHTEGVPSEPFPLHLLLFDETTQEAVEGANLTMEAWMPPHDGMGGHGTMDDRLVQPTHRAHGLYNATLFLAMEGPWWLNVTVVLQDGSGTHFEQIELVVGNGSHEGHQGDDGHQGMDHGDNETPGNESGGNETHPDHGNESTNETHQGGNESQDQSDDGAHHGDH